MNVKRTVTLGVVGGAVVVWLAAAATSPPRAIPAAVVARPTVVDQSGAALAAEIARLHERLRPTAAPDQTRDLFRYAARPSAQPIDPGPVVIAPEPLAVPAALLPFKLVGLAEDYTVAGVDRSAILSGLGDLFIVKEGDMVGTRYRVVTVAPDGVDLLDLAAETSLHIPLK